MAEHSLRGMKIGANSLESDENVTPAQRKNVWYDCPNGHSFTVTFYVEAVPPAQYECKCGAMAQLRNMDEAATDDEDSKKSAKPQRTHWDMLMERRSEDELKELLDERLELLHSGRLRIRH
ncbi:MAG: RNA polymerase-binding protein RbpA [Actinomycetaceae bacterium]|nr:RNA polymerase-binding protein RbpA [Actinomycetaceae bacterium]MDY6083179.1 RNA polymerase-binding protein RbpA [Actinomycetaceae bacterium]